VVDVAGVDPGPRHRATPLVREVRATEDMIAPRTDRPEGKRVLRFSL